MALTRAFLKSLGLDEDKVTSIIEAHTETVNGLKSEKADLEEKLTTAQKDGETLKTVQKELDDLKKDDYKGKYERLFDSVEKGKTRAAKETAVKAYYEGKSIKGGNLAIAMRGTDLDKLELDDNGQLKDTSALDELVNGDFKPLVSSIRRTVSSAAGIGSHTETPPSSANEAMNRLIRGA